MLKTKIAITGAGLSGMLTALSLASMNIETIIIEPQDTNASSFLSDIRTTALTSASQEFLSAIDVWQQVDKIATTISDVYVVDNKSPHILHFPSALLCTESLGCIVQNFEFKKILLDAIHNNPLIKLIDKISYNEVKANESSTTIILSDNRAINCELLIICSGYKSSIYKTYFSPKILKYYNQSALTFNVLHQKNHEGTAVEHFLPSGPFAILPLHGGYRSSVVWTIPQNYASLISSLPKNELEYITQRNFGDFLGKLELDSDIAVFPLMAYITQKYYHKRIALVADSAHITHPLAGQGLNQGIKDIDAISKMISSSTIDEHSLLSYQNNRAADNMTMYLITDKINSIFTNNIQLLKYPRAIALQILQNVDFVKTRLLQYAMGKR